MGTGNNFAADLLEVEADLAQTVTISGATVACVAGPPRRGYRVDTPDGYWPDADIEIVVRQSLLATTPVAGILITHSGVKYRVLTVATDDAGINAAYVLSCGDLGK